MGESLAQLRFDFNHSILLEPRPERLTVDMGALLLRETMQKLGIISWLTKHLHDRRDPELITHPFTELLRTSLILLGQGWRDQDDADALRQDPAFRLAVSNRRGTGPLKPAPEPASGHGSPSVPEGLASQPTLSRLINALSNESQRRVLRDGLLEIAHRRLLALRRGHRQRYLTVDIDSLPFDVYGHQPGSQYNGYYHRRIYHPLIASIGETGDLIDGILRPGAVHTAKGAEDFILPLLDAVEQKLCQTVSVRIDAGFPEENLLKALEDRRTGYVSRVGSNEVLDRLAKPYLKRPAGRPPSEPRMWLYDMTYQAEPWSRARRVVLVVQERPDELFLHHFWLITDWSKEQMSAHELLELYRERGSAESYMGELKSVLEPALSSSPRPKRHYRGCVPSQRFAPCDAFAHNEVLLLLNMLAYNICHAIRVLMEKATGQGWSLRRLLERVLKRAGRFLLHSRYVTVVIGSTGGAYWASLLAWLDRLRPPGS